MHTIRTALAALLEQIGLVTLARWVRPAPAEPERGGGQGEEQ